MGNIFESTIGKRLKTMHKMKLAASRLPHISVIAGMFLVFLPVIFLSLPVNAQANASDGEKLFKKCVACHKVGEGAKNGIGPVLTNVVGRVAGTQTGYKFGKSIQAAGAAGLVWDEALIVEYIADPRKFLRAYLNDKKAKARMKFKLKDLQDRENIAAYLASLSAM